jgi:tetratricopeptide (TPR) repeat protein
VEDNPGVAVFRTRFVGYLQIHGDVARRLGRTGEARDLYERAIARLNPSNRNDQSGLITLSWRRGLVLGGLGDPGGAAADVRRAPRILDESPPWTGRGFEFETACCHAAMAGLAGRPGSGVSTAEGQAAADRAMEWLRRAVAMGFRNLDHIRIESALDPLRSRDDFRLLMMDIAFPIDPFAPGR